MASTDMMRSLPRACIRPTRISSALGENRRKAEPRSRRGSQRSSRPERKRQTLRTEDVEIRFIRPDVAIVYVTNELSGLVAPDGQKLPPQREMSIRVFVKNDGRWQVAAFHNTMVNPFGSSAAGNTGR